jgi:hypothetical protein
MTDAQERQDEAILRAKIQPVSPEELDRMLDAEPKGQTSQLSGHDAVGRILARNPGLSPEELNQMLEAFGF